MQEIVIDKDHKAWEEGKQWLYATAFAALGDKEVAEKIIDRAIGRVDKDADIMYEGMKLGLPDVHIVAIMVKKANDSSLSNTKRSKALNALANQYRRYVLSAACRDTPGVADILPDSAIVQYAPEAITAKERKKRAALLGRAAATILEALNGIPSLGTSAGAVRQKLNTMIFRGNYVFTFDPFSFDDETTWREEMHKTISTYYTQLGIVHSTLLTAPINTSRLFKDKGAVEELGIALEKATQAFIKMNFYTLSVAKHICTLQEKGESNANA